MKYTKIIVREGLIFFIFILIVIISACLADFDKHNIWYHVYGIVIFLYLFLYIVSYRIIFRFINWVEKTLMNKLKKNKEMPPR